MYEHVLHACHCWLACAHDLGLEPQVSTLALGLHVILLAPYQYAQQVHFGLGMAEQPEPHAVLVGGPCSSWPCWGAAAPGVSPASVAGVTVRCVTVQCAHHDYLVWMH